MGQAHDHSRFTSLEFIPFAHEITKAVRKFAQDSGLDFEPFYHDLPVWIVHEHECEQGRVRRLQVVGYVVADVPHLSFVKAVDVFLNRTTMLVPKKSPTTSFPTFEVLNDLGFDSDQFTVRLQHAWSETETLTVPPEDLVKVTVSDD